MALTLEQARAAAARLTGLTAVPQIAPGVSTVDRTPFIGREIASLGAVWDITWTDVRLSLPSAPAGMTDQYSRTIAVRLSQSTGQLLGIVLRTGGGSPSNMRPTPDGEPAEQQLLQLTERYVGLPRTLPRISMIQALDAILTRGVGNPLRAREIQMLYVSHVRQNRPPIPAWVVTLNGIPPIPHRGPAGARVPVWQLNHIRNVVNAETGVPLFATTIPQPSPTSPLVA